MVGFKKMHDYVSDTVNVTCPSEIAKRIYPKSNNPIRFVKFPKEFYLSTFFALFFGCLWLFLFR